MTLAGRGYKDTEPRTLGMVWDTEPRTEGDTEPRTEGDVRVEGDLVRMEGDLAL